MADERAPVDEQPPGGGGSTDKPDGRRPVRRVLYIVIGLLIAFVIYAFAFQKTDVSLDEIQDETRQEQLFRILRALVRPDLITYDQAEVVVSADVLIPCQPGSDVDGTSGDGTPAITVTPACASPGEPMTITGSSFEPEKQVTLQFIPESEFVITLPLWRTETDVNGSFVWQIETPER